MVEVAAPLDADESGESTRPAKASAPFHDGVLGGYRLEGLLGSGGMASVYRAAGRYAIKVLHPHLREDEGLVADFLREGRVGRSIRHPNVVGVHECVELPEALFLVLDLVEGQTLASLLVDRGPLPPAIAVRVAADLLRGLHAAHEATSARGKRLDLIHCDVTPHNVLVGADGVTRLADFGIARVTERFTASGQGKEIPSVLKGKLRYMAPEQVADGGIDRRVDVWAAGVVCWEMLVGKRLFEGGDGHVLARLFTAVPPRVDVENPDVPPALAAVVAAALCRSVEGRYATAEAFADALEAWAQEAGVIAQASDVAHYFAAPSAKVLSERRLRAAATAWDGERASPASPSPASLSPASLSPASLSPASLSPASPTDATKPGARSGNLPSVEVGPPSPSPVTPISRQLFRGVLALGLVALAWGYRARPSAPAPEAARGGALTAVASAPSAAPLPPATSAAVRSADPAPTAPAIPAPPSPKARVAPAAASPVTRSAPVPPVTSVPVASAAAPAPAKSSGNSIGLEPCPYCTE